MTTQLTSTQPEITQSSSTQPETTESTSQQLQPTSIKLETTESRSTGLESTQHFTTQLETTHPISRQQESTEPTSTQLFYNLNDLLKTIESDKIKANIDDQTFTIINSVISGLVLLQRNNGSLGNSSQSKVNDLKEMIIGAIISEPSESVSVVENKLSLGLAFVELGPTPSQTVSNRKINVLQKCEFDNL